MRDLMVSLVQLAGSACIIVGATIEWGAAGLLISLGGALFVAGAAE